MSFEIVEPGQFAFQKGLEPGEVSLNRCGRLMLRVEDLETASIGPHYAIVLADAGNLRIALRAVRDGEESQSVAICTVRGSRAGRDSRRRAVHVTRALKRLGIEPAAAAGRYELFTKGEGPAALLIINLVADGSAKTGKGAEPKRGAGS